MGEPRIIIAVDPDVLNVILAAIERLERKMDGATITARDEWELLHLHAARVGVQQQTVRKWVREGKIDSRRVGGRLYVRSNPAG